jgi:acyl-coenzyme A synthetase/AMP-(fatty) acid ligase
MTVRRRLALLLNDVPDSAPAIEFGGQWWTWDRVRVASRALEHCLDELGVGPAGRVGIVLENRPEHVAAVIAVLATDRCLVTLSGLQPPERLASDVERSQVPVVVATADALERASSLTASGRTVLRLAADGSVTVMAHAASPPPDIVPSRPGVAIEMLTSGSTGPPKRVSLTDTQLDRSMVSGGQRPGSPSHLSKSAAIIATPLVHIGGLWGVLSTLYTGRRIVLLSRWTLDEWVRAVETFRPRASGLVPAAMRMVLDAGIAASRLSSLQVVTTGTAPCPAELADEFYRRYGIPVLAVYGATEFAGAVAGWTLPLHHTWWDAKKGSAGRAFPGVELRIADAAGTILPPGGSGHLEIKTRQAPPGSAEWVRTSDLARLDEDGFLWIEGRADDAIIRGGFKVAPDTVKRVLESHPGVREAGVTGRPDPRLGAVPVAGVELAAGVNGPSASELIAYCRTRLLPYEVPAAVVIVAELPRTPSMKISQVELLELVQAGSPEPVAS